jgi:hypothetical protein
MQVKPYQNSRHQATHQQRIPLIPPDVRLHRLAHRMHELGPRAIYEYFREIADGADPIRRLETYCRIDPQVLHELGGNDLPRSAVTR